MGKRIILNPVTRISGFMELDVTVENNVVTEAKTKGILFRGFEQMLQGRKPFDAVYFTQRICGICSAAHSIASSLALEQALGVVPPEQGRYLRDIIHCAEFLQNHIRHFYQHTIPDFVKLPNINPLQASEYTDFRLPEKENARLAKHYVDSLQMSRLAHQMLAVLGGKAPHNHGVFIGGITMPASADKIIQLKSTLQTISTFVEESMIPDVYTIAQYYPEYYKIGAGYGNFLSYGLFYNYQDISPLYVKPSVYTNGKVAPFNSANITENITYSWHADQLETYTPFETMTTPDLDKEKGYSWVKAPRYNGLPYEVGPLARQWLSGEYRNGISTMDRDIARVLETKKITEIMAVLLDLVIPEVELQKQYSLPNQAEGEGLTDTIRGALGHWLKIDQQVISFYQIITPSAWDFSTRDEKYLGTVEQALIGTPIQDENNPVELGRILRSFDPCMSCATHVYRPGKEIKTIQVIP
ncbi:nickel-dependent hydrogenase large subunit [Bacillus tianshenii]|nr:nickel-dependent hydrogenase large subunit [Bacillus tianshenii]